MLTFKDTGRGDGGEPHAVADEQDYVLGPVGVSLKLEDCIERLVGLLVVGVVRLHERGVVRTSALRTKQGHKRQTNARCRSAKHWLHSVLLRVESHVGGARNDERADRVVGKTGVQ